MRRSCSLSNSTATPSRQIFLAGLAISAFGLLAAVPRLVVADPLFAAPFLSFDGGDSPDRKSVV